MASILEQLEADVRNATAAGFRGNLLARGQARSMIWRNGELPRNAPSFSTYLSYDLESYGYALLGMGLRLRELDGDDTLARMAFEQAATAIESVVSRGNPEDEARGFHHVMAAAGFHLGHFSARAYSLLAGIIENGNLAPLERALNLLMLRNLEQLDFQILSWKTDGSSSDDSIIEILQADAEQSSFDEVEYREEEPPSAIAAIDLALTDNFLSAVAIFLLALERGESSLVQRAITMLKSGLETCRELNLIPQWWSHRIGVHLIDDLWSSSFHVQLPEGPDGSDSAEWRRLRRLFIALLYRRRKAEIDLWPSQIDAAARAIDQSDDLVVSLPTSAGKTRVAELCILNCLASGKRVVFVTPLRALSAQTEISLRRTFLPLGKKVSALYGSIGSSDFEQDTLKSRDIVVATPEKLDFALRNDPSLLDDVGLVVFDEGHMIGPNEREVRYEVQIQRLLKRPDAEQRRVVCLSAILPNGPQLEDFVAWFCRDKPDGLIQNDWRPTRLRFGEVIWYGDHAQMEIRVGDERPFVPKFLISKMPTNGRRRAAFPQDQRELTLATAWRLVEDGQTVLIYCPERRSVEPFADAIVDLQQKGLLTSLLQADRKKLATARTLGEEWLGAGHSILRCLDLGIAIHHGALPTPFRKEIEKLLHEGILKVTISSPTLAQGLNLSATAVVIHSLYRDRKIIDASEFKNVVGRAGRAYVDVEGLVLYPIFDSQKQRERLDQWGELIQKGGAKNMESGLAQLVMRLLARMYKMLGKPPLDQLIEYVTNNTQAWDFHALDSEDEDEKIREHRLWRQHLSSLDTAILSLLGDQNVEIEHIATMMDTVLTSSLWERSLKHRKENTQKILKTSLAARANYIWTNSSANQRRGYFLAGVGLDAGKQLDAIAQEVNALLLQANTAILSSDEALAIQSIIALAERIFSIPPFVPEPLPSNWMDILRAWLEGEPISTVTKGHEGDALRFVEGGLVYRLPWGMEAIRVRAAANQETNDEGLTLDEVEMGLAVPAVENGTLNRSAALLMQAGFSSRLAAIKAVNDTAATFTTGNQLTEWIDSDVVVQLTARGDWPTPETTEIWKSFVDGYAPKKKMIWDDRSMTIRMTSVNGVDQLTQGMAVRLIKSPKNFATLVISPSCEVVGELERSLNEKRIGLTLASIGEDKQSVDISYLGPDDIMIPS